MRMKKAQSAMEYLMTYGWAILIVIIVAAALYALGIFNPATYTGRIPTGFTTLGSPSDWELDSQGDFDIILTNRLSTAISVTNVSASLVGGASDYNETHTFTIAPGSEYQLLSTESFIDLAPTTLQAGVGYSVDVQITYNAGGLDHTETGRVTGTIQQG